MSHRRLVFILLVFIIFTGCATRPNIVKEGRWSEYPEGNRLILEYANTYSRFQLEFPLIESQELRETMIQMGKTVADEQFSMQSELDAGGVLRFNQVFQTYPSREGILPVVFFDLLSLGVESETISLRTMSLNTLREEIYFAEDILNYEPEALAKLSVISFRVLLRNSEITDIELLEEGTNPIKENFDLVILGENGIYLLFEPGQILAATEGIQEIFIPYGEISDILKPGIIHILSL